MGFLFIFLSLCFCPLCLFSCCFAALGFQAKTYPRSSPPASRNTKPFSANENNPCHWMLHEATHQLNHEVAHLKLEHWLEEGLAEYFSTSRLKANAIEVGRIDPNTYPVWLMDLIATSPDLAENLRNGSVIPLRCIITAHGGPSLNSRFNLYYLHWWTLTYFVFESPQHRDHALALVQRGGGLDAFEQLIGPVETVQPQWHAYVRRLKAALSGSDLEFFKKARGRTLGDSNR